MLKIVGTSIVKDSCFVINNCGICGTGKDARGICDPLQGGDQCKCFQHPSNPSIIYEGAYCTVKYVGPNVNSVSAIIIAAVLAPIAVFGVLLITILSIKSYRARKSALKTTA